MMNAGTNASITASETFRARAQRGEALRVAIWMGLLASALVVILIRRALGGAVMSSNVIFFSALAVFVVGISFQVFMLAVLRKAIRAGNLLPRWVGCACIVVDFSLVAAMLAVLAWESPRGALPALSAPALMFFPVLILTSVLRLSPRWTVALGVAAALFHWALALRALHVTESASNLYPVYLSYGVILLLTGIAGMLVSSTMRLHVQEAMQETTAREQADARNALVQRDLTVARDIQRGLLPSRAPKCDGYEMAGFNRAADLTGGDYYDWQLLPDGKLVVALADVTGHGIGPAIVMAVCRAYARASTGLVEDPSDLMLKLNQLLQADLPADRFITLAVAMCRPSGAVQLLSAGHGPTLLYRAEAGTVEEFGGDGLPLGVDADELYPPANQFQMDPDDVLLMVTDGFFEWHRESDGEQFGVRRLTDALRQHAGKSPEQIITGIDQAVRSFVGDARQQDDMTAVVIKRTVR